MAKKIKLRKTDIESIRDIVELLTKRKSKKRKSKGKKGKTTSTTKNPLTQDYLNYLGPKMFGGSTPSGLFNNPYQPIVTPAPPPTKPSTDWDDMFKKLLEAQTKAYTTPSGITPTGKTPTPTPGISSASSSSSSGYPSYSSSSLTPMQESINKAFEVPESDDDEPLKDLFDLKI